MEELIKKQRKYIKFLEDAMNSPCQLASIHGWICPEEIMLEGNTLREEIKKLENIIHN